MKKIGLFLFICLVSGALLSAEEMSSDQWLQYNDAVTTMLDALSDSVHNGEAAPIKCATPLLNGLLFNQPKGIDAKVAYTEREDTMSFTYSTNHFLLHYTDNGANRVYEYDTQTLSPGVPDYIVIAGRVCDSVWDHTVGDLGFTPPISDGYYNGGGNGLMDIYFIDFPAYGATVRDSIQATLPMTMTCYMFMENDYENFPGYESDRISALQVSIAHEFFHTVQFAIDAGELEGTLPDLNPAWIEMSATFMEEENYDAVNDYVNYLHFFYDIPQWSVRTGTVLGSPAINYWRNLHMYASVIFPIFLSERYGSVIVRDIWNGCGNYAGPNWWLAADAAIKSRSGNTSDLQSEFQEFALWNLFTKQRTRPGEYFPEAIEYDTVNLAARITSYPATITPGDSICPDNLGADYIMLQNVSGLVSGLAISFNPDTTQPWGVTIVGLHNNVNLPVMVEHVDYDTLTSLIRVPNAAEFDRIAVIVSVLGGDAKQVNYSMTISEIGEGVTVPNGGETWYAGFEYDIRWYIENAGDSVRIEYSTDNGFSWNLIAETENDLVYTWLVPETPSDSCLVRITDLTPPGNSVESENVFTIRVSDDKLWEPFPNPAWVENDDAVYFKATFQVGAGSPMTVTIMTLAGEKVKTITGEQLGGQVLAAWDFTNDDGRIVAAGPYLAIIDFMGETTIKKFVVLR